MKILITMAGRGSRFKRVGVSEPKHEITVKGRPMFDWAMLSLEAFFDEEFIFVTQSEHEATEFLTQACSRLGISDFSEVSLTEYTDGQAETALKASPLIDQDESVAIYNIDTYIEQGELAPEDITGDGFVPSFKTAGERWSFIQVNENGEAIEFSEKEKISDIATAGFYYFRRWRDFVSAFEHESEQIEEEYGEVYVAPLYNKIINEGKNVIPHHINADSIHVLGTPKDLQQFDSKFSASSQ